MSGTLRIIHAADLHLDSPFEALGEKAVQRRAEQRELLRRIAGLANEKRAHLLLLAGDLLDTNSVYAETGLALCDALSQANCPVFISPGNHDYYSSLTPYARLELPENVHVFKNGNMECAELPELGVRVWGAAFTDCVCPPLLQGVHMEKEPGMLDICLLHGEVGNASSRYDPISEQDIAQSGMDYIALGHIHSFSGLRRAGDTYYAWPGCAEGRGFDECGEKGVLYIELSGESCTSEFVPICGRKYEIVGLDVSQGDVEARLPQGNGRDICRLILTGETDMAPDVEKLSALLKERFFAFQIQDRTSLARDIWEKAEQDTLRGLFLRKMRKMYDEAADVQEKQRITQAARWGLAALDGGEAVSRL